MNEMNEKKLPEHVPYMVHQGELARAERHNKRMFIALVVAVILLFASNAAWLIYESLYDTITYEQDGGEINNINTGEQGDVAIPSEKSESQNQNSQK